MSIFVNLVPESVGETGRQIHVSRGQKWHVENGFLHVMGPDGKHVAAFAGGTWESIIDGHPLGNHECYRGN